uniref:Uncharacterized protein n=1 Tax=Arion vulgaris TaxID=1028688 RepID=A0A0B7BK48_9EUPU
MIREMFEYIVTTGKIYRKRDRGQQRENILYSLTTLHSIKTVSELIASTRYLWKNMITYAFWHGT